ncbi:ankyrin repeat domain-containing protein [Salicola sp. Rm-C-2C1-2]|uniref:ankyrin repeat domain-containing protein n=1 Tax=Salicola sp. Rm-C-2C1-2 TaxID=3141321 RepID=UPI0032E43A78
MQKFLRWSGLALVFLVASTAGGILYEFSTTSTFQLIVVYMDKDNPAVIRWSAKQAFYAFHPGEEDVEQLNREAGARYVAALPDSEEARSVLDHLVSNGVDINSVDKVSGSGFTALHAAVLSNDPGTVEVLLNEGADPSLTDHEGRTPLDLAQLAGRNRPDRDFGRVLELLEQASFEGSAR